MSWVDERYIIGNEHRITECESTLVLRTKRYQFWLPVMVVGKAQEMVSYKSVFNFQKSRSNLSKDLSSREDS